MIEDIKKEILEKTDSDVYDTLIVQYDDVIEILDKYNNRYNATAIIEDIISTIRDFKENDIEAICKVLLNKYRNTCGNCLKCDYFTLAKFKNAWEELKNTTIFSESYTRENKMSEYYDELFKDLESKHGIGVE